MTKPTEGNNGDSPTLFYEVCASRSKRKTSIEGICPSADPVSRRVLEDYGAIFIPEGDAAAGFVFSPAKRK